jgi:mRNA interferase RelE/StbE
MYKVKFLPKAEKQIKKIARKNKPLIKDFQKCILEICQNPFREAKVGDLQGVWGYGFRAKGVAYRIAYIINEDELYIFIIGVGTHEGFWSEIKKYWQKYLKN